MSNVIEFPDKQGLSDEEIERRAEPLADAITALLEEQPISVRWAALTNVLIGTYFDFDKILMKHSNGVSGVLPPEKVFDCIVKPAIQALEDR